LRKLIFLLFILIFTTSLTSASKISIDAPEIAFVNNTFNVSVFVEDVDDLYAVSLGLVYNKSLLSIQNISSTLGWEIIEDERDYGYNIVTYSKEKEEAVNASSPVEILRITFKALKEGVNKFDYWQDDTGYNRGLIFDEAINDSTSIVTSAPIIQFKDLKVEPIEGIVPLTVTVSVTVVNVGNAAGEYNATLTINDQVVAYQNGTLNASESKIVTFQYTFNNEGTYYITVDGLEPIRITVYTLIGYYDLNSDGKISGRELLLAIQDWRDDKITGLQLLQVIQVWRTS